MKIKNEPFKCKSTIILCMWVIFILGSGFLIFEDKGLFGEWFQVFGAVFLVLVGLYDLLGVNVWTTRIKGLLVTVCSLLLLIPALQAAMAS